MASAALMQSEMLKEAYYNGQSEYYQDKSSGGYFDDKSGDRLTQHDENGIFVEEAVGRRLEGQNESSSGDDSFGEEINKEREDNSSADDDSQFATLQTVNAKYMDRHLSDVAFSGANSYEQDGYRKSVESAQQRYLDFPNVPVTLYQSDEVDAAPMQSYRPPSSYNDKYETGDNSRQVVAAYPYQFPVEIKQEVPYGPHSNIVLGNDPVSRGTAPPIHDNWGYSANMQSQHEVKAGVFLCNRELWAKFHTHITEMIVTKQGR